MKLFIILVFEAILLGIILYLEGYFI